MAYWIRLAKGNTEICVEDLFRTVGLVNGKYPGICQHCGKTGIRYIAHVRQDVADTLARALGNETEAGGTLAVSEADQDALSVAVLEGKEHKQVDVGCVCVAKYFEDCGVDAGLAKRAQEEVTKIMHVLQEIAALEGDSAPECLDDAVARWNLVAQLRNRVEAVNRVKYWEEPSLVEQDARNAYLSLRQKVRDAYEKAAERWKRETHGFNTYFSAGRSVTPNDLLAHYTHRRATAQRKLAVYGRGAQYV